MQDRRYTKETATMHYYIDVARNEFLIIISNLPLSLLRSLIVQRISPFRSQYEDYIQNN